MSDTPYPALKFALGARVVVMRTMERRHQGSTKLWAPCAPHAAPSRGVVVGVRYYQDGYVEYLGDDGAVWHSTATHQYYLVAVNLYRAPLVVRPEDTFSEVDHA